MKKILLVLLLALGITTCVGAQMVFYQDQATLLWDPVTTDASGDPLLPMDTVEYEIYIYDYVAGVLDDQDPAQLTYVGITSDTQLLIVFPYRTRWVAGGRCKVTDEGGNVDYSLFAWSTNVIDTGPDGPFLYVPLPRVPALGGLRDSGM
jgi:hypothetical protein